MSNLSLQVEQSHIHQKLIVPCKIIINNYEVNSQEFDIDL